MIFLELDDLKAHSFQQYIDESAGDFVGARDVSELQNISIIKSKLKARFDVNEIFRATGGNRDAIIVRVLSLMVIYDLINRNKARKVPKDIDAAYQWALDWLKDVRDNKEFPDLPPILVDGTAKKFLRWGNNANKNNYL